MPPDTDYLVMTSSAGAPKGWGRYKRVALVEVLPGAVPRMISERATGVVKIVRTWERLNVGTSGKCAFSRAKAEAEALRTMLLQARAFDRGEE